MLSSLTKYDNPFGGAIVPRRTALSTDCKKMVQKTLESYKRIFITGRVICT